VFSLTELPRRLGVIGADPIGCELAQSFAQLGSEVFLVESEHGILPRGDREAAKIVQQVLVRDGVKLFCCGRKPEIKSEGGIRLTVESHDKSYDEPIDHLLVAVGRAPNVENLNLEGVGIDFDKKGVKVNDRLQTTNPRIYAAGDICSPYQFTHAADFMARIVIQNALFKGRKKSSSLKIPWCTYTSPEISHVGLYEHEAKEQRVEVDIYVQHLSDVDLAILEGEDDGFAKVHVKKGTDQIVGATIVARNAGDMIFVVILIAGLCVAYANGANDNFKRVAILFGSAQRAFVVHCFGQPSQALSTACRRKNGFANASRWRGMAPPMRSLRPRLSCYPMVPGTSQVRTFVWTVGLRDPSEPTRKDFNVAEMNDDAIQ
jgi:pyruvate/2-oxoglutarate dehydrogenase complex dihydrolipoamide dehydrogenase (E3) component